MSRLSADSIFALKEANPIEGLIGARVKLGRPNGKGIRAGQCLCEPARGKEPLWVNPSRQTWGCLKGGCGGDIFSFLRQFDGLEFSSALEKLGGRDVAADPAAIAALKADRDRRVAEREKRAALLEEAERAKAHGHWQKALPTPGTLVDAYFRHRGLEPILSPSLKFAPSMSYWHAGEAEGAVPQVIYRGPAMLAAFTRADGKFGALHITWLDPRLGSADMPKDAKGKAEIVSPDGEVLPAKKMRGPKQGGAIRLTGYERAGDEKAERVLVAGEGIETTASVLEALRRRPVAGVGVYGWAAGDLGNLAGAGLGPSSPHPDRYGRWVPSEDPDPEAPGMMPPAWASAVMLVGDGDSDAVVTRAILTCAKRRFEAAGFPTEILWAPAGQDFNDVAKAGPLG